MTSLSRVFGAVLFVFMTAHASIALAQVKADFLVGTFASAKGCKMYNKLQAGTPRSIETVPDTLDADGFHGWEGACEFTKVWQHQPGMIWQALMYCSEGNTAGPQMFSFARDPETGTFDVSSIGQQEPETFHLCDKKKDK
ncbi:MAG: hypothetical protein ACRBCJ_07105 [Hyphomicrobiaceae bacterium]